MRGNNATADSAAAFPVGDDLHPARTHGAGQVVANAVGHGLVENAVVAETLVIHFQTFQFNAHRGGLVAQGDISKVGVAGLGAHAGELLADVLNHKWRVAGRVKEFKAFWLGHFKIVAGRSGKRVCLPSRGWRHMKLEFHCGVRVVYKVMRGKASRCNCHD